MKNIAEIVKRDSINKICEDKQTLFENKEVRLTHLPSNLEVECLGEKDTNKRDLSSLAIFSRNHCALTNINKILVLLSKGWRLDFEAWKLITTLGFFGKYSIAFISTELHQNLLLKSLEKLEYNIKSFRSREKAENWLSVQN